MEGLRGPEAATRCSEIKGRGRKEEHTESLLVSPQRCFPIVQLSVPNDREPNYFVRRGFPVLLPRFASELRRTLSSSPLPRLSSSFVLFSSFPLAPPRLLRIRRIYDPPILAPRVGSARRTTFSHLPFALRGHAVMPLPSRRTMGDGWTGTEKKN